MRNTSTAKVAKRTLPRGWYVLGLASMSWALAIVAWNSVAAGLAFLLN